MPTKMLKTFACLLLGTLEPSAGRSVPIMTYADYFEHSIEGIEIHDIATNAGQYDNSGKLYGWLYSDMAFAAASYKNNSRWTIYILMIRLDPRNIPEQYIRSSKERLSGNLEVGFEPQNIRIHLFHKHIGMFDFYTTMYRPSDGSYYIWQCKYPEAAQSKLSKLTLPGAVLSSHFYSGDSDLRFTFHMTQDSDDIAHLTFVSPNTPGFQWGQAKESLGSPSLDVSVYDSGQGGKATAVAYHIQQDSSYIENVCIGGRDGAGNFVFQFMEDVIGQGVGLNFMVDCSGISNCDKGDVDGLSFRAFATGDTRDLKLAATTKDTSDTGFGSHVTLMFFSIEAVSGVMTESKTITSKVLWSGPDVTASDQVQWTSVQVVDRGTKEAHFFIGYEKYTYWLTTTAASEGNDIRLRAMSLHDDSGGRVNKIAGFVNIDGNVDAYVVGRLSRVFYDAYGEPHLNSYGKSSNVSAGFLGGFEGVNSLLLTGLAREEPSLSGSNGPLKLTLSNHNWPQTPLPSGQVQVTYADAADSHSIQNVLSKTMKTEYIYSNAVLYQKCSDPQKPATSIEYVVTNCSTECLGDKTEVVEIPFFAEKDSLKRDTWFESVGWQHTLTEGIIIASIATQTAERTLVIRSKTLDLVSRLFSQTMPLRQSSMEQQSHRTTAGNLLFSSTFIYLGALFLFCSQVTLFSDSEPHTIEDKRGNLISKLTNPYVTPIPARACEPASVTIKFIKFIVDDFPQTLSIQRKLGIHKSDPMTGTFETTSTPYAYEFEIISKQVDLVWIEDNRIVVDSSNLPSTTDFQVFVKAYVLTSDGSRLSYDLGNDVYAEKTFDFSITPETDPIGISSFIYSWSKDSASQPMTVPIEMPANLVNASPDTVTTIVRHYATSAEVTKASFSVARNTLSVVMNDIDDFADSQYQISDLQIYAQIAIAGEDIQYHASNTFTVSMFTYEAVEVQDLTYEMNESAHTAWLRLQMPIFKGSMLPPSRNCTLYSGDRKILAEETTAEWVTYDAAKNDDRVLISTRDFDLLGAYSFDLACTVTVGALSQTTWNPFMIHLVPSPWVDLPEPEPLEAYVEHQVSLQPQVIYAGVPYSWPVSPALLQGNATSVELASDEFLSWHLSFDQASLTVFYDGGAEAIESTYMQLNFTVFDSDQYQLGQYAQDINLLPREAYADPLDSQLQEQGKGEGQGDQDANGADVDELGMTLDGPSRVADSASGQQTKASIFKFVLIQKRAEDFEDLTTLIEDQREHQTDASLQAQLASVSNSGVATITFSQSLQFPEGIKERINQEADSDSDSNDSTPLLEVVLVNQVDGVVSPNLVSWKAISVEDDQIELQLTFEDPVEVSNDELPDLLHVQLAMSEFKSDSGDLTLPASLVKRYPVPPQHPSQAAKQVFQVIGATTIAAMMGASSSSAVVQFAMNASFAQLFAVLNSQQMVVYLPLLRATKLPANVVTFNSFTIQLASFDLIDTETIDEALYSLPEVDPFNANFAQFGFESLWLVGNSGFLLWVLYGYAVFAAIVYASKRKCCKLEGYPRLRKLLQSLERHLLWNGLTRLHMEAYLDMAIFASLNLSQTRSEHASPTVYYSTLLSCVLALFLLVGPPLLLCHSYRKRATWGNEGYSARHGALLEGTAPLGVNGEPGLKAWQIILIPTVFYTRRFVFTISIVFITRALPVQISLQMSTSLLLTAYLIIVKPLESQQANWVEIFNEVTSLMLMYLIMGFNDVMPDPMTRYWLGVVYICVSLVNISVLFYLLSRTTLISLKQKLRTNKCCQRLFMKGGQQAASIGAVQSQERASSYVQDDQHKDQGKTQGKCGAAPLSQINEAAEEEESSNSDHGESSSDEQKNPKITLKTLPKPHKDKPVSLIPAVPFITVTRTEQLEFSAKMDQAERQIARNIIMQKYHESAPTAEQLRIVHETGVKLPVQKLIDRFQQARAKAKPRLLDSLQFEMCQAASAEGSSASIKRRTSQQMYDQIEEEAKKWLE